MSTVPMLHRGPSRLMASRVAGPARAARRIASRAGGAGAAAGRHHRDRGRRDCPRPPATRARARGRPIAASSPSATSSRSSSTTTPSPPRSRRTRPATRGRVACRPPRDWPGNTKAVGLDVRNDAEQQQRGSARRENRFQNEMSVRVVAIAPNGLLQLKGTKNINVDKNGQDIVFTGFARPQDISMTNSVESNRVADAQLGYLSPGPLASRRGLHQQAFSARSGHESPSIRHLAAVRSRRISLLAAALLLLPVLARAQGDVKIRDLTSPEGALPVRLVGYGLVVGLDGTGDRAIGGQTAGQTVQSVINILRRFNIEVPADLIRMRNVAAVLVTAEVSPFLRSSGRFEVNVSSHGRCPLAQGRRPVHDAARRRSQRTTAGDGAGLGAAERRRLDDAIPDADRNVGAHSDRRRARSRPAASDDRRHVAPACCANPTWARRPALPPPSTAHSARRPPQWRTKGPCR